MAYGGAAAAAAAAIAQAVKASGAIMKMEPDQFQALLTKTERSLVVVAEGGLLSKSYSYLFGHKGLVFYTKSGVPLMLPGKVEVISATSIWIPG